MATPEFGRTGAARPARRVPRRGGGLRRRGRRRVAVGLLAYLQAEIDQGAGLEQAVPSDREAVKLLTVHKAKGLEWEVVFLPALMKGVFPSDRVTDNWVTNPAVLPADLRGDAGSIPQLADTTNAAMADVQAAAGRAAAAGRGPAGLRGGDPGQAAAGRHRPLLAGRPDQPPDGVGLPAGDRGRGRGAGPAGRRGRDPRAGRTRWSSTARRSPGRSRWIPTRWRRRQAARGRASGPGAGSLETGSHDEPDATTRCCSTARTWSPAGTPTWTGCWPRLLRGAVGDPAGASCRRQPVGHGGAAAARGPGRRSPPSWPGRCRGRRRGRPGSAPGSTLGGAATSAAACRAADSASSSWSTPTTCPTAPTSAADDEDGAAGAVRARSPPGGSATTVPYAVEAPFTLLLGRSAGPRPDRRRLRARRRPPGPETAGPPVPGGGLEDQPGETADPLQLAHLPAGLGRGAARCRWSRWTRSSTTSAPTGWSGPEDLPDAGRARALLTGESGDGDLGDPDLG